MTVNDLLRQLRITELPEAAIGNATLLTAGRYAGEEHEISKLEMCSFLAPDGSAGVTRLLLHLEPPQVSPRG